MQHCMKDGAGFRSMQLRRDEVRILGLNARSREKRKRDEQETMKTSARRYDAYVSLVNAINALYLANESPDFKSAEGKYTIPPIEDFLQRSG